MYIGNPYSSFQREFFKFLKLYSRRYGFKANHFYIRTSTSLKGKILLRLGLLKLFLKINMLSDVVFVEFIGDNAYFSSLLNVAHKPMVVRCHRAELYEYWEKHSKRVKTAAEKSSLIICVAKAIKKRLINLMPWAKDKTIVVYNSVDPLKFYPKKIISKGRRPLIIGSLGALIPRKGFIELIKVLNRFVNRGYNIKLKIGGKGPLYPLLKKTVSRLGLEQHVMLEGFVKNVPQWYQTIDLFILNSKSEGLPTVILEAMASGLPVIATNVGGISEALGKEWVYDVNDYDKLEDLILKIYNMSPDELQKIGVRNRQIILNRFNIRKNIKVILSNMEKILE